ncbi:MAG: NHL repeat-containing protein [Chloroflexi bacterium]|nr:NHL repeat-containing protein [Chloroflexota bacterium]
MDAPANPQSFHCPSCGAGLPNPTAASVTCEYCGAKVLVPPEYLPKEQEPQQQVTVIHLDTRQAVEAARSAGRSARPVVGTILFISVAVFIAFAVLGVVLFTSVTRSTLSQVDSIVDQLTPGQDPQTPQGDQEQPLFEVPFAPTAVPFAELTLQFGSPGDQPGQLDDARYIAIDAEGNIFVADYGSGRVHKFGPAGEPLLLIQVPSESGDDDVIIQGLDIAATGLLYIASQGKIFVYNTSDGAQVKVFPDRWPDIYFESLAVGPQGEIYSTNGMAGTDDIVFLDGEGKVVAHWQEVIQAIEDDDPAMSLDLATSPSGNLYLLSPMQPKVYAYSPAGEFLFQFGEEGTEPGQIRSSPNGFAVDPEGRVYIIDSYTVNQYDSQGNYLASFEIPYDLTGGVPRDLAFDDDNNLYAVTAGGKVVKYHLNEAGQ